MSENLKPLIGIPCRYNWTKNNYELRETYPDAIHNAGGVPVLVPLIAEVGYIESVLDRLDAICLSGSNNDLNPLIYGQEPKPQLGPVIPRRDETDLLLLAGAEARQMPVLAICFGAQSLNVYRGGTLIQDINTEVKGAIKHDQGDLFWRGSHSINITEDSLLAEFADATRAVVNSHHHQSIDIVGRNLEPIAWAADGVIEAVIDTRPDQFILGVQWHPEVNWSNDPLSKAIFKHFVSAAREHMKSRIAEEVKAGD